MFLRYERWVVEPEFYAWGDVMKYFTIDWYKEMQVAGFLVFPETREEWDELLKYYHDEGIDFQKTSRENMEYRKQDLLKYLPESFHSYIYLGTLNAKYPTKRLREMVNQWTRDYEKRTAAISKDYVRMYEVNKEKLSKNVVQFYDKSLHDAQLKRIARPVNDVLIMNLDCRGGFHYFSEIRVIFTGVKEFYHTGSKEGGWWLTSEIYPNENGFDFHVLLDNPMQEMKIVAADVRVEEIESIE